MNKQNLNEEINRISQLIEVAENKKETEKTLVVETSLNRIWYHSDNHDIAIISASRVTSKDCLSYSQEKEEGENYTPKENRERNGRLKNLLLSLNFGVTEVSGTWVDDFGKTTQKEYNEQSFFVVNREDIPTEDFNKKLIQFGKFFCQDSILLKPKGKDAYLYGTNRSDYPGLNRKEKIGSPKWGKESQFMTRVGKSKKPFTFMEDFNVNTRYLITKYGKELLEEIEKTILD